MSTLEQAREHRADMALDEKLDQRLSVMFGAKDVTPAQRFKLRNLLKFYAKQPKPFTQCVRDNRKRFPGPGQVERICGTIVALIGRHNSNKNKGGKTLMASDEEVPVIDDDTLSLLDELTPLEENQIQTIYEEAIEVANS
jgi:hypothetical protein